MKRTLCFAALAVIAAGCNTQPVDQHASSSFAQPIANVAGAAPPVGEPLMGPTGLAEPVVAAATLDPANATGAGGHGTSGSSTAADIPGRMGHQGPAGAQDRMGEASMRGPMSIRLTGPAGSRGQAIAQGAAGQSTLSQADAQGPVGGMKQWTPYQSFTFDFDRAEIRGGEMNQVSDIAAYLARNPSIRVGLDSSNYPRTTDWRNQDLGERRVAAIRDALIRAGTPPNKIQVGSFGDPQTQRNNQVEVLLISAQ